MAHVVLLVGMVCHGFLVPGSILDYHRTKSHGGLLVGERAKQARHCQECTNSSWCDICGGTCAK